MKFKKLKKQQRFWMTMSAQEAVELMIALLDVEPEDLDPIEERLIESMREPLRRYLSGTKRHAGHLPERVDDLLIELS